MSRGWPKVKLAQILDYRKDFITIDDAQEYVRPRVRLHAQGIVSRDRVFGTQIKTKKQQICKSGDFLVAEIDAKMGGFGIVPEELDGAIVSSHYFLFHARPQRVLKEFLGYYCKTSEFRNQIEAQGSTNYAAIRPSHVLEYVMPLPSIDVQRRVVHRMNEVQRQLQNVDKLRALVAAEQNALCRSLLTNDQDVKLVLVADLVRQKPLDVFVEPDISYQFAGVYSFGRGVFKGNAKAGAEFAYPKLSRVQSGDFIYPKLMAWEGALGVVPDECDGFVVSPEFPVFEIDQSKVLPDVFDVYFRNPSTWESLQGGSTGTNARRRRLSPTDFLKLKIPVPSMKTQQKLATVRLHQRQMRELQVGDSSSVVFAALLNQMLT